MSQTNTIFSAARIMSLEKKLLSRNDIKALYESDAMRVLQDKAYGGQNAGSEDLEKLIEGELAASRKLTQELSTDKELTDAFFIRNDVQNLKRFIKKRLMGGDVSKENAQAGGLYEPALLALMVKSWEFPTLPDIFKDELKKLDVKLAESKNPQLVSVGLDKAYYRYVRSIGSEFAEKYFGTECDFINLETLLRMKGQGIDKKYFEELLLPEYKIGHKLIVDCFTSDIKPRELTLHMPEKTRKKAMPIMEDGNAPALQKLRDDTLMSIARERKADMESVYPVVWYYLARVRESEIIRLCVTMKRSGFGEHEIEERLRELYG